MAAEIFYSPHAVKKMFLLFTHIFVKEREKESEKESEKEREKEREDGGKEEIDAVTLNRNRSICRQRIWRI